MFARIAIALPVGVAVTAGLLFMMHLFIETGHGQSETVTTRSVDFVRIERDEIVQVQDSRPEKPEAREAAPDLSQPQLTDTFSTGVGVSVETPAVDFKAEISGIGMTISDGEYLPVVKVAPRYPVRALQRRLEGYVIVEFVVTTSGAVREVRVVESTSEIFEAAAVEAALKFKYKPRVVDGMAIAVAGVQNRISFRLDV